MQIGKQYRHKLSATVVTCVFVDQDGFLYKNEQGCKAYVSNLNAWEEIKEPVVRYVHWYRSKDESASVWCITMSNPQPKTYVWNDYLKTDRVTCDG